MVADVNVFGAKYERDDDEPRHDERVADQHEHHGQVRPAETTIEPGHDEDAHERERRQALNHLLRQRRFRDRAGLNPPREERSVTQRQIDRDGRHEQR